MTAAVVALDGAASPDAAVACVPLHAIVRAGVCVLRQQLARARVEDRARNGNAYPTCRRCECGERVAASVGARLIPAPRLLARPRGRPPGAGPKPKAAPTREQRDRWNALERERRAAQSAARRAARPRCSVPGCAAPASRINARATVDALRLAHADKCSRHRVNAVRNARYNARRAS